MTFDAARGEVLVADRTGLIASTPHLLGAATSAARLAIPGSFVAVEWLGEAHRDPTSNAPNGLARPEVPDALVRDRSGDVAVSNGTAIYRLQVPSHREDGATLQPDFLATFTSVSHLARTGYTSCSLVALVAPNALACFQEGRNGDFVHVSSFALPVDGCGVSMPKPFRDVPQSFRALDESLAPLLEGTHAPPPAPSYAPTWISAAAPDYAPTWGFAAPPDYVPTWSFDAPPEYSSPATLLLSTSRAMTSAIDPFNYTAPPPLPPSSDGLTSDHLHAYFGLFILALGVLAYCRARSDMLMRKLWGDAKPGATYSALTQHDDDDDEDDVVHAPSSGTEMVQVRAKRSCGRTEEIGMYDTVDDVASQNRRQLSNTLASQPRSFPPVSAMRDRARRQWDIFHSGKWRDRDGLGSYEIIAKPSSHSDDDDDDEAGVFI